MRSLKIKCPMGVIFLVCMFFFSCNGEKTEKIIMPLPDVSPVESPKQNLTPENQDKSDKVYDYSKIKPEFLQGADPSYLDQKSFDDAFPDWNKSCPLNSDEKKIIGEWYNYWEMDRYYFPVFFPNRFMIIEYFTYLDAGEKVALEYFFGTWDLKGTIVHCEINGYTIIEYQDTRRNWKYSFYRLKNEISFDAIDINDIHPDGFTLKPFPDISMPKEVVNAINPKLAVLKGCLAARRYFYLLINTSKINKRYFTYASEMCEKGITGEMIVANPEDYRKYLEILTYMQVRQNSMTGLIVF